MVHQQTNNHLSPLPLTSKQSSLTITINKQPIVSHHYHQQTIISHYHQQTNNHLSPLTLTSKQSSLSLLVNGNGER
jgi:hypothetical protein